MRNITGLTITLLCSISALVAANTAFVLGTDSILPHVNVSDNPITLQDWAIIGANEPLGKGLLSSPWKLGGVEPGFTDGDFTLSAYRKGTELKTRSIGIARNEDVIDILKIFKTTANAQRVNTIYYAACAVYAEKERTVVFQIASDDAFAMFVNGELVTLSSDERIISLYDNAVSVKLAKGYNTIVLKIVNYVWGAAFAVRYDPSLDSAATFALERNPDFLDKSFYPVEGALMLDIKGAPVGVTGVVEFIFGGRRVGKEMLLSNKGLAAKLTLQTGIYGARLKRGKETYLQAFLVGDPLECFTKLQCEVDKRPLSETARLTLKALKTRLDVLLKNTNRAEDSKAWRQKVVHALWSCAEVLSNADQEVGSTPHVPGIHFRGFTSKIDGCNYFYRISIPVSSSRGPMPLLIVLPPAISASRPFLESPFAANHDDAVLVGKAAGQFGVIVLWPGYPHRPSANPRELTYLDEIIEEAVEKLGVDKTRIYLSGMCSAGITVGMADALWPKRFAALLFKNPNFRRTTHRFPHVSAPSIESAEAYQQALRALDPFDRLAVSTAPILIVHDGGEKGHGELKHALEFISAAQQSKRLPNVWISPPGADLYERYISEFAWLAKHSRFGATREREENYVFDTQRSETIYAALAEKFVVIQGTVGSVAERAACASWAESFRTAWMNSHFGTCEIIEDYAWRADSHCSNLVIIGNEKTNMVWKAMIGPGELKLAANYVEISGERTVGSNLNVQAVLRSPRHPKMKIVAIGSDNMTEAMFGTMDLGIDGWYQYAIWASEAGGAKLVKIHAE